MLTRRRKQVTLQRAMAFVKRLSMLSLHVLPSASVGILAANRATIHVSVFVNILIRTNYVQTTADLCVPGGFCTYCVRVCVFVCVLGLP